MPPATVYDPPPYSWARVRTLAGAGVSSVVSPVGLAADEDPPAALRRMALDPVQVVAIEPRLAEQDCLLDDLLDGDRRAP